MAKKYKVVPGTIVSLSAEIEVQVDDEHTFDTIAEDYIVGLECMSENLQEISLLAEVAFKDKYKTKKINKFQINHIGKLDTFNLIA